MKRQNHLTPDLLLMPDASTEEVRAEAALLCAELVALQSQQLKHGKPLSNAVFSEAFLAMNGSTWGRLITTLTGGEMKYDVADWRPILGKFQSAVSQLKNRQAQQALQPASVETLEFPAYVEIFNFIKAAQTSPRNRLIPIIGVTGAGKTRLAELIAAQHPAKVVRITASQPWLRSYTAMWRELARALKLSKPPRGRYDLQQEVTALLKTGDKIIIVDECQYADKGVMDGMKFLCENTGSIFVLLTTPEQWKHVKNKDWDDMDQFLNRLYAQVVLCCTEDGKPHLDREAVGQFVRSRLPQFAELEPAERTASVNFIAQAGEHFGLWNKVSGLCEQVSMVSNPRGRAAQPITLGSFRAAAQALVTMGRY